jgi:hypothetical protein
MGDSGNRDICFLRNFFECGHFFSSSPNFQTCENFSKKRGVCQGEGSGKYGSPEQSKFYRRLLTDGDGPKFEILPLFEAQLIHPLLRMDKL